MPRKGVIVYAGASDWFRGRIDSLYKDRKTSYRAKVWNLPLEIRIAGLENMAARKKDDGRIDRRRNYEKLWRVLNNLDACDIFMHSL